MSINLIIENGFTLKKKARSRRYPVGTKTCADLKIKTMSKVADFLLHSMVDSKCWLVVGLGKHIFVIVNINILLKLLVSSLAY